MNILIKADDDEDLTQIREMFEKFLEDENYLREKSKIDFSKREIEFRYRNAPFIANRRAVDGKNHISSSTDVV